MFNIKFVSALATISVASAFAPVANQQSTSSLNLASGSDSLNGWVPDESKFAYGLPGSLDPVPDFDPLGNAINADISTMKTYREAENTHGRVAMLACVGFLVTEAPFEFHPLFDIASKDIGPAMSNSGWNSNGASVTRNPINASMATRPWVISASH